MFDSLKKRAAYFIVKKKLKHRKAEARSFISPLNKAVSIFLVMPESEDDFRRAFDLLEFFERKGKKVSLLTQDYRVSLLPAKHHAAAVDYGAADVTKLSLPGKKLEDKLSGKQFDAVIDLERKENIFNSAAANIVKAPLRVGIKKKGSDIFYNLQISVKEDNPELFYKNFLNCLEMF